MTIIEYEFNDIEHIDVWKKLFEEELVKIMIENNDFKVILFNNSETKKEDK